jgi:hypothetical protein
MTAMQINEAKFNRVVEMAKSKTNNKRWLAAIDKAADAIINDRWIITELMDGCLITTEFGETYHANGVCQCQAFRHGQACKHRAAARLIAIYGETADEVVSTRSELIAYITNNWPKTWAPMAVELMRRFRCNSLRFLDDDILYRVRSAIAI